jgi:hypothetical protein
MVVETEMPHHSKTGTQTDTKVTPQVDIEAPTTSDIILLLWLIHMLLL